MKLLDVIGPVVHNDGNDIVIIVIGAMVLIAIIVTICVLLKKSK